MDDRQYIVDFATRYLDDPDGAKRGLIEAEVSVFPPNLICTLRDRIALISPLQEEAEQLQALYDERDLNIAGFPSRDRLYFLQKQTARSDALQTTWQGTIDAITELEHVFREPVYSIVQVDAFLAGVGERCGRIVSSLRLAERQQLARNREIGQILQRYPRPGDKIKIDGTKSAEYRSLELKRELEKQKDVLPDVPIPVVPPISGVHRWHMVKKFQNGGMGRAHLFIGTNAQHRIVARKVRKTCIQSLHGHYRDVLFWRRDMPLEWYCQTVVSNQPDARFAAKTFGEFTANDPLKVFEMELQFCAHGDLEEMVTLHQQKRQDVPEKFLWLLLQSFVENGLIMEQGGTKSRVSGWMEIVHRDIKLDNIFLDLSSEDYFPEYPTPKLADFGLSFFTHAGDESNPLAYGIRMGTVGYHSPEQVFFVDKTQRQPIDEWQYTSKTNVWQFAAVMFELMHLKKLDKTMQPSYLPGGAMRYDLSPAARSKYSKELCAAVDQCLEYEPDKRPTFQELAATVKQHISQDPSLRRAAEGKEPRRPRWSRKPLFFNDAVVGYQLGMTWR